jgi:SusD family.
MNNLANFTGWMSGEADWGYSSLTRPGIDRALYDKIAKTDFRKYTFVDPKKYDFYDYQTSRDKAYIEDAPAYLSLKFRCLNGDWKTYSIGGAVDVPVMRVEEMYLIEAEAVGASQGVSAGVAKLNYFMQNYRQADYNCKLTDLREFQLEVLTQMRIEFWGEGNAFPTAKRLKPGVIQNYDGTNAPADIYKINCKDIKPNWNLVIPINEMQANSALAGKNNPDPTGTVKGPSPVGQYASPK